MKPQPMKAKRAPDQDGWHYIEKTDSWYWCAQPHMDELVLHSPGSCRYCDRYPKLQGQRITDDINFTGEYDEDKDMCMSEIMRPLEEIEVWYGNRPIRYED